MLISRVRDQGHGDRDRQGALRFTAFEGTLEAEVDGAFKAHGTTHTASIDTDDPKRDEHLRAPELFEVGGYPEITFVSSGVRPTAGGSFGMFGNLTIKGVSRPIALTVTPAEVSVRRTPIPRAPPWDFHVLLETRGRTPERPWSCAAR